MTHVILITIAAVLFGATNEAGHHFPTLIDMIASMVFWLIIVYAGYGLYLLIRQVFKSQE